MVHDAVIAHRGAASHAPENTLPAFDLAWRVGAGCVEHDLQITSDGVLVCIHDRSLERTTNVRERYPDRGVSCVEAGRTVRRWYVCDFTLHELRGLDAGAWFDARFAGAGIPTYDEALAWARGRVALLTELKDPEAYEARGVDMLGLCADALRRHGLPGHTGPVVVVQSFHEPTARRAGRLWAGRIPVQLLIEPADLDHWRVRERFAEAATFAQGLGPGKALVRDHPGFVVWAHAAGLRVTPWTFRPGQTDGFTTVRDEIEHYLRHLGVDAVITDDPAAGVAVAAQVSR